MFRRTTVVAAAIAALSTPWSVAHAQSPTSGWLDRYYDGFTSPEMGTDLWLRILMGLDVPSRYSARRSNLESSTVTVPGAYIASMPALVMWSDDVQHVSADALPCGGFGCATNSLANSFKFFNSAPPARLPAVVPAASIPAPEPNVDPNKRGGNGESPLPIAVQQHDEHQGQQPEILDAGPTTEPATGHADEGVAVEQLNSGDVVAATITVPAPTAPLASAPEPSTIVLVATGVCAVGLTGRRSRTRKATSTTPR